MKKIYIFLISLLLVPFVSAQSEIIKSNIWRETKDKFRELYVKAKDNKYVLGTASVLGVACLTYSGFVMKNRRKNKKV